MFCCLYPPIRHYTSGFRDNNNNIEDRYKDCCNEYLTHYNKKNNRKASRPPKREKRQIHKVKRHRKRWRRRWNDNIACRNRWSTTKPMVWNNSKPKVRNRYRFWNLRKRSFPMNCDPKPKIKNTSRKTRVTWYNIRREPRPKVSLLCKIPIETKNFAMHYTYLMQSMMTLIPGRRRGPMFFFFFIF